MTCNLLNNKAALIEAFDKVSDSNSRKHWLVYTKYCKLSLYFIFKVHLRV